MPLITYNNRIIKRGSMTEGLRNGLAAEFMFSNNYSDTSGLGNTPYSTRVGYIADRLNNTNAAVYKNGGYISWGNNYNVGLSNKTISFWVSFPDFGTVTSRRGILTKGLYASNVIGNIEFVTIGSNNTIQFGLQVNSSGTKIILSKTNLVINTWYHCVITINRTGLASMYINNVLESSADISTYVANDLTNTYNFLAFQYSGAEVLSASNNTKLDDLRIWNRVLTLDEINYLYTQYGQFTDKIIINNPLKDGLVREWLFNNTLNDTSGNNVNATVVGTSFVTDRKGNANGALRHQANNTLRAASIGVNNTASLALWIKNDVNVPPFQNTAGGPSVGYDRDSSHYPYTDGKAYLTILRNVSGGRVNGITLSVLDKTNWHLFVVTTTPGVNGWKLYQNTTLITQVTGFEGITFDTYLLSTRTNANISEMRIWNRVLTIEEITLLYNS